MRHAKSGLPIPRFQIHRAALLAGAALMLSACNRPAQPVDAAPAATDAAATACADGAAVLPALGLCPADAAALIPAAASASSPLGEDRSDILPGCTWVVNATTFAVDEAVVYHALSCKGVTTTFEYAGGAHRADLMRVASALYEVTPDPAGETPAAVEVYTVDPANPGASLEARVRETIEDKAVAEKCVLTSEAGEGRPADAVTIAPTPEFRATETMDEPSAMCGPYGKDEDSGDYWRIAHGYAWYFRLGQDISDFDSSTLTLVRKGADGKWSVVS